MIIYSAHNGRSYDVPADASIRCAAVASSQRAVQCRRCRDVTLCTCRLLGTATGRGAATASRVQTSEAVQLWGLRNGGDAPKGA